MATKENKKQEEKQEEIKSQTEQSEKNSEKTETQEENLQEAEVIENTTKDEDSSDEKEESKKTKKKGFFNKKNKADEELEKLQAEKDEFKDKYLRLTAEFDNYRKRTLKEKADLIKNGGEDIIVGLLPIIDDFERALKNIEETEENKAVKEGVELIYGKMNEFLKRKGVKVIDAVEKDFDADYHEAITKIPAPDDKLKGKVIDEVEKGYLLNDKVIRYTKVVIGE